MESIKVRLRSLLSLVSRSSRSGAPFPSTSPMLTLQQNAANYVSESVQGTGAEASKEANKSVAKDGNASLSTRATAAKDAVVDKKDEVSHNTKGEAHKGKLQFNPCSSTLTDAHCRGCQALNSSSSISTSTILTFRLYDTCKVCLNGWMGSTACMEDTLMDGMASGEEPYYTR